MVTKGEERVEIDTRGAIVRRWKNGGGLVMRCSETFHSGWDIHQGTVLMRMLSCVRELNSVPLECKPCTCV
jgi:hypothetical protein